MALSSLTPSSALDDLRIEPLEQRLELMAYSCEFDCGTVYVNPTNYSDAIVYSPCGGV
jgi:hypothetical protein